MKYLCEHLHANKEKKERENSPWKLKYQPGKKFLPCPESMSPKPASLVPLKSNAHSSYRNTYLWGNIATVLSINNIFSFLMGKNVLFCEGCIWTLYFPCENIVLGIGEGRVLSLPSVQPRPTPCSHIQITIFWIVKAIQHSPSFFKKM